MAKQGLSVKVKVKGLAEIRAALNNIPDNAQEELKDAAYDLSVMIGRTIRAVAYASGSQATILAGTVSWGTNEGSDTALPEVQAGGTARIGRNNKPAYQLLFGSEFGIFPTFRSGWYGRSRYRGSLGRQYHGRTPQGTWFFPTVEAMNDQIAERWSKAAANVIDKFEAE